MVTWSIECLVFRGLMTQSHLAIWWQGHGMCLGANMVRSFIVLCWIVKVNICDAAYLVCMLSCAAPIFSLEVFFFLIKVRNVYQMQSIYWRSQLEWMLLQWLPSQYALKRYEDCTGHSFIVGCHVFCSNSGSCCIVQIIMVFDHSNALSLLCS